MTLTANAHDRTNPTRLNNATNRPFGWQAEINSAQELETEEG
jgi:hypothetical protein